ncbi:MAG: hypothetical protein V4760_00980 [Bdellovibrionota bacterium]
MRSKFALAVLLFAGFLSQGCSTPNTGSDFSDYEMMRQEAWSAYGSCVDALGPHGRTNECDNVNGDNPYAYQSQQQTGYYQPVRVQQPSDYYGYYQAPPYYLYSAEPSDVRAMTEKWLSLAEEPEQAL